METLQEMLQQIDWDKLLPIFTFFIGLSYSFFDKYWDRKRERENLKTVLFFEIGSNHYLLSNLPDWEQDMQTKITWAVVAESLDYSIYKEYLGKINVLKPNELDAILIAYDSIERLVKDGNEYMDYLNKKVVNREDEDVDQELLDKHSELLHNSITHTKKTTSIAVKVFVKGREDLLSKIRRLYRDSNY